MMSEKGHKAIELGHHLSEFSRLRNASPLKSLQKYLNNPNVVTLAGGLPSPAYFPFSDVSAEALTFDSFSALATEDRSSLSWLWRMFGASPSIKEKTSTITIPKYPVKPGDLSLSTALQYGPATGQMVLQKIIREFTKKVYQPAYEDWVTLIHTGATDGWHRVVATLCNKGEMILASEWTYPSAMITIVPYGASVAPVGMDGQGMRSDSLRDILANWDVEARGAPRPHVMYIVPVGQNPTGTTMGAARKQELYDICVEYDIVIVEDDPYYFLQEGPYVPKATRSSVKAVTPMDSGSFLATLESTFLKIDYQGRVIRLDTFSKTVAPGSRLGWFTCNPMFAERFEMQGETTTQAPCGFSQAIVSQLLTHWKHEGYIRWLQGLGAQYTVRRDHMIDLLDELFDLSESISTSGIWEGCHYYSASRKTNSKEKSEKVNEKSMFSFIPPTSGMFIWLKLNLENVPIRKDEDRSDLETLLWVKLAEAGCIVAPGWIFSTDMITGEGIDKGEGRFRMSFSNTEFDVMRKGLTIFADIMQGFFNDV